MRDPFRARPRFPFSADISSVILRPLLAMKKRNAAARTRRIVWPEAHARRLVFEQTPPAWVLRHI